MTTANGYHYTSAAGLRYHATRLNEKGVFAGVRWRYLKGWPGKNNKPP
jgi:hypothetical protein